MHAPIPDDPKEAERRRKLKELEQRVPDLVQEDLRKEIHILLTEIHEESLKNKGMAVSPTQGLWRASLPCLALSTAGQKFKRVGSSDLPGRWFFLQPRFLFSRLISAMMLISMTSAQNKSTKIEPRNAKRM